MNGPEILARTMSVATTRGKGPRAWQYHSRSDAHSKVACWTVLFDLMSDCDVMRRDAEKGLLGFGINHCLVGPINKTLDLVVTRLSGSRAVQDRRTFADMIETYDIVLDPAERDVLRGLPSIPQEKENDISEIVIALEAKACMTEHIKSIPRLHAEILATGYLAKRASPRCIAVSYSLINAADSFATPSAEARTNRHSQPADARRVIEMLSNAIPLARDFGNLLGYDVVGATTIDCRNDGSPVTVHQGPASVRPNEHIRYERMIKSICSEYRSRFGS